MVNKDFFSALADLEHEKGISGEIFIEALSNALASACKKQFMGESGNVEVRLNPEKNTLRFFLLRTVVEGEPEEGEISLEDAVAKKKSAKVGDVLSEEFIPKDFGRIAAQTAKQVILQKLHETERDNTLSEFSDKEGELMSGLVRKIDLKNVYVELGKGQIEGLMLPQDQVPGEKYEPGDRIKVYVKKVRSGGRNAQVLVSRTAPGLVKRLFEDEVPEIKQGSVVIKSISREPGHRTKMAIFAEDAKVDAVGACVGNKGARVNAVVQELGGEKIDIILWSENPLEFIAKALSPATVLSVTQLSEKSAIAVVPDDKLSLAIGRDGQNARLAARLTGWKIDVKSESAAAKLNLGAEAEEPTEE
ncbi:MAG: transcription termination/antitermination protein NusA [Clostridia bacterium]|nr:transcription termination/antitermination protein NusA [Clostridia bacterium]